MRGVTEIFLSDSLQGHFCGYFDGKTDVELEELLSSFSLREEEKVEEGREGESGKSSGEGWAVQRGYLNALLRQHNGRSRGAIGV